LTPETYFHGAELSAAEYVSASRGRVACTASQRILDAPSVKRCAIAESSEVSSQTEIVHIVLVQWSQDTRDEHIAAVRRMAFGLPEIIDGLIEVVEGFSVSEEGLEGGFDWAMVLRFRDAAARDAYLPHPDHQLLAHELTAHAARVVVFDV
jgi:Stress responsive A/B Barrel Domain